ncbi:MAG: TetR/AcrR family transcriptional regulator [Paracoccaceae bacterium]
MTELRDEIAARLETAFAARGMSEPGVAALREASGVSLRTLYRHFPSREAMVEAALERRHARYLAHLFDGLPTEPVAALDAAVERVGAWMAGVGAQGCLFHAAVAADPDNEALRALRARHKREVAERLAAALGRPAATAGVMVLHEGLVHAYAIDGAAALDAARVLGRELIARE